MRPVCLSVRFLYLSTTAGLPVVSRYVVCVMEERLDGANGGKTSTSLERVFQLWTHRCRGFETYMEASGRITVTSASSTTAPPKRVIIGTLTMCLPFSASQPA